MIIKFLKKYYLFAAAIILTMVFAMYYGKTVSTNYQPSVEEFRENFKVQEDKLEKFLDFKANEIDDKEIHEQWVNHANGQDINVHIYRRDSLIYWNTNQLPIIRFADIHFPSDGLLNLQNGWYFAKTKKIGRYLVCASFLIKHDYAYENNHLINSFSEELPLTFNATIGVDENEGYKLFSKDKEYVCSLVADEEQPLTPEESIALMLLLLAAIVVWFFALARLHKLLKSKWNWIIPVSVIAFRVASIKFSWLDFMSDTEAFNPSLYGANLWFPNFFEYLVNITVIVYLLFEIRNRLPKIKKSSISKL